MVDSSTSNQSDQLQINLLDNALDSLLSAAEAVRRDQGPRSLKEAVLHLANGVELLVKSRLAREHWSLIFSNINKASFDELAKADFGSVDFPTASKRLEHIVGVSIDKSVSSHVENLRKLRNQITHFTATLDSTRTKSLVAKAMAFCIEFCEQQEMLTPDAESKLSDIHINLTEFQEFVDDRMETILGEWNGAFIWECPECWQSALVIDGGEQDCKFCRHQADSHELAEKNSESYVESCPECGEEATLAFILNSDGGGRWVCFFCGQSSERYDHCMRCTRVEYFHEDDDVKICAGCWSDIMSRE